MMAFGVFGVGLGADTPPDIFELRLDRARRPNRR
jgi:hypothetical protein